MNRLRDNGYLICPASSAAPVELRGVRRDGVGLHFRCRGTAVRLAAYRPGRTAWQVAVQDEDWCPEESLQLWAHRPLTTTPPPGACLAFPDGGRPDHEIIVDGAELWGWTGHEAGLLRPPAAADLFDHLHTALTALDNLATPRAPLPAAPAPLHAHTPGQDRTGPTSRPTSENLVSAARLIPARTTAVPAQR